MTVEICKHCRQPFDPTEPRYGLRERRPLHYGCLIGLAVEWIGAMGEAKAAAGLV